MYQGGSSTTYPPDTVLKYEIDGDINASFSGKYIATINNMAYFSTPYDAIIMLLIGDSKVIFQFLDYPDLPDDNDTASWISYKYYTAEAYIKSAIEDAQTGGQEGFDYLSTEIHPDAILVLEELAKSNDESISEKAKNARKTLEGMRKKLLHSRSDMDDRGVGTNIVSADKPDTWAEKPGPGTRIVSYSIEGTEIDFYLISLSIGHMPSSVNRFRRQVGLPAATEEEIGKDLVSFSADGHNVNYIEIYNEEGGKGIIAAIVDLSPKYWYFKASGSVDELRANAADIRRFLETLKIQ